MLANLILLTLLLAAPRPAQAQGAGSWYGRPCDAPGNSINQPYNDGFYTLTGPQSGTISHTYPLPMINAALAYPSWYSDYLSAGSPLGGNMTGGGGGLGAPSAAVSSVDSPYYPNARVGVFTPGLANAPNHGSNGEGSYSVDAAHGGPSSGGINGSVTADMSGTLVCYFHMYWSGPGPQPASAPFLVSAQLFAQASMNYESAQRPGGLSATATVTDGALNDTVSASAGDAGSLPSPGIVNRLHIVQVPVDPKTGIAKVTVDGKAHWVLSNTVPYATAGAAVVFGGSYVQAGAIPDSRNVTISADVDATSYKFLTGGVDANGDAVRAKFVHAPEPDGTMRGDIGLDFGDYDLNNPQNYVRVKYTANPVGNWAENLSQYLWNTSRKNASYPGTLHGVPPNPGVETVTNVYRKPYIVDDTKTPQVIMLDDAGSLTAGSPQVDHLFFKYQNGDNRPSPWTPYVTGNDGDGAIATTNYYLYFHQAHEFISSKKHGIIQPGEGQENIIYRDASLTTKSSPPLATSGNGVQCEWNAPSPFWDLGEQAASVLSNAPWPNKWVGSAVALAGVLANNFGPHPDSATINFDSNTWNDPASQFPTDFPKGKFPMVDYNMTPGQHLRYLRHYQLNDAYGIKGFESENMESFDTYAGKGPSFGIFTWAPIH